MKNFESFSIDDHNYWYHKDDQLIAVNDHLCVCKHKIESEYFVGYGDPIGTLLNPSGPYPTLKAAQTALLILR